MRRCRVSHRPRSHPEGRSPPARRARWHVSPATSARISTLTTLTLRRPHTTDRGRINESGRLVNTVRWSVALTHWSAYRDTDLSSVRAEGGEPVNPLAKSGSRIRRPAIFDSVGDVVAQKAGTDEGLADFCNRWTGPWGADCRSRGVSWCRRPDFLDDHHHIHVARPDRRRANFGGRERRWR